MKKIIYTLLLLSTVWQGHAQVGIGTNTPDNSAMLEVQSTQKGILFPRMTSAQRTSIASPAAGLYVYDTNTKSLWYYNGTLWINTVSEASFGDVKSGFQTTDHSGWIKLDGRAISTLNAAQQAVAISLGFTTNLPDATSAYLVQESAGLGTVSGTNTTTLTQANLPNVNFSGTAANAGDHAHNVDPASVTSTSNGDHAHSTDPAAVTSSTNGSHTHSSNANGGPSGYGLVYADGYSTNNGNVDYTWGEPNAYVTPGALSIYANGNHTHTVDIPSTSSSTNGAHAHTVDVGVTTSTTAGVHSHSVTVASGGSATPIDITPKSLVVNMFVYLGQ